MLVLEVFAVISLACAPDIVVVLPSKAVPAVVPNVMLVLAVFDVIADACEVVIPVLAVFAVISLA